MIRKFLVVSNRVSFAATKYDEEQANTVLVDLIMPLDAYWEINRLLHKADYLMASQEQTTDIQEIYRQVFKEAAPYAVSENDRNWLFKRAGKAKKS